jgi:D-alanyl-D-alanine carboxypeptidase-like protein
MSETSAEPTRVFLTPPDGLDQIRSAFGDIFQYILPDHTLDPRWQSEFLTLIELPFSMPLSWDKSRLVTQMTCHKIVAKTFSAVFGAIKNAGLQEKITSFGGCFSFRPQRTGAKLSTHAWGIAVDLNPETNQQGTAGSMDAEVVTIFMQAGFSWGGDWEGRVRDPMHFQFCTGY